MDKTFNLLALEAKRFFSRKNIFTIIVAMIAVVVLYRFMYEENYNNYLSYDRQDIDVFLENYKVHGQDYLDRIRAIQSSMEEKKDVNNVEADMDRQMAELEIQQCQRVFDAWKDCQQFTIMGWYYQGKDPIDEEKAVELYTKADKSLEQYEDIKDEIDKQGVYRFSHKDWEKRMALHKAYEKAKKPEPLCKYIPTGAYAVAAFFGGKGMVFFGILTLIFFLNYDAWCKEFEDNTYVITFTLPYTRTQISIGRWFVRVILTSVVLLIICLELMALGAFKYGIGMDEYVAVLSKGSYVAITYGKYLQGLMFYMFILCAFVVTFVLFISVLLKDSINSLGIFFFFNCLYMLSSDNIHSKYNPVGLLRVSDIMTNEGQLPIRAAMVLFIVYIFIELVAMTGILVYRED